jgi:uncharacterized protein (UPF0332 family)
MNQQEREELISFRISKAKDTLKEVDLHIENELWNTAVNRLYYACYYAVSALLLAKNINTKSHKGARQMFGLHYGKTGIIDKALAKFFTDLYDMRQTGDYDDFIEYSKEDILDLLKPANDFISQAEEILTKEK